jgi:hypothetical protein
LPGSPAPIRADDGHNRQERCAGKSPPREVFRSVPANRRSVADHAILVACTARAADLVVMGVNHHSALNRLVFGSIAARVAHAATCPVLIVPAEQKA